MATAACQRAFPGSHTECGLEHTTTPLSSQSTDIASPRKRASAQITFACDWETRNWKLFHYSLSTFSDFLGHVLTDFALVGAEGGGITVEQPQQIALKHGPCRLVLTQVVKCHTQVPSRFGRVGVLRPQDAASDGKRFFVQLARSRKVSLRSERHCQVVHRGERIWVLGPQH